MVLLFFFLSLYVGINIRVSIILGIIEALVLIAFIFYRFGKKIGFVALGCVLIGVSISFIRPSFNKSEYQSIVIESKDNYFICQSSLEKFYISRKENEFEVGDIVTIKGEKRELDFTVIESGFDFKKYLNNKGIYSELIPSKIQIKFLNPIKIHKLKKNFLNNFDDETKSLVSMILFGNNIESDTLDLFRDLHLIRLISNSGIFLHLIFSGLIFILSYLKKDKLSNILAIIIFAIYGVFTYPRFVVIKFVIMKILRYINKYKFNDKFAYLDILSAFGIGCLLFDYHLAYQDSFLLAFLIPIFSLFFNGSFKSLKKIKKKLLLSLFIYILFIPFSLNYNNEISLLSMPFQIILIPFTAMYGAMGFLCFLGIPLYSALGGYTQFLNKTLNIISHIFIKIYAPPFSSAGIVLFEITFFAIVYFISIKFKDVYKILIPISLFTFAIYLLPVKRWIRPSVTFINVGQGDSCLICYKNESILIDTGGSKYKDYAKDCLIPYFKKQQIYSIDLLITTHDDIDHSGAVESLINNFKVENYVKSNDKFPITISDLTINNLNTFSSLWEEDNDKSLILEFTISNVSFLITGDAPKKIENKIVEMYPNLNVDVLKVGHHGSNTSTSDKFINLIRPKEAIISCGKNNSYGHPHQETLTTLKRYGVKIRRTDYESSIKYVLNYI